MVGALCDHQHVCNIRRPSQLEIQDQGTIYDHLDFNAKAWNLCAVAHAIEPSTGPVYLVFTIQERGNIFKESRETDKTTYGPVGLELAVSHQLVQIQGGRLSATSRETAGSTFTFFIKTYRYHSPDRLSHAATAANLELVLRDFCAKDHTIIKPRYPWPPFIPEKEAILVVDDNMINRRILTKQLEKNRYVVHTAANGEEALELLSKCNTRKSKGRAGTQIALVWLDGDVCSFTSEVNSMLTSWFTDASHGRPNMLSPDS